MDIPKNNRSESRTLLHDQNDSVDYGTAVHADAARDSNSRVPTSRSFTEQIDDIVGSYSRTSIQYMTENLPIPASAQPSPLMDRHLIHDEEQHVDRGSIHSDNIFEGRDQSACFTHLGGLEGQPNFDERSSLMSFHDSFYSNLDRTFSRATKDNIDTSSTLAEYPHHHKSSFWQSVFNSTNILLGIGILAMPLGFKLAGWVIGIFVFAYCFGITNYTAKLLAECLNKQPDSLTYGDIGAAAFGMKGRVGVSAFFITELIAVSVALVVFMNDEINALYPGLSPIFVNVLSFCILTPMLFVPVRHLSYASLLGIMIAVSILGVLLIDGFSKPDAPGSLIEPAPTELFPSNWSTLPLSFGLIMAGFAGHSVFPTIYRDMENPKDYNSVVNWTYVATAIVYFLISACGYLMFGQDTLQEITQNIVSIPEYNRLLNLSVIWLLALNPVSKYGLSLNPVNMTWQVAVLRLPAVETWCANRPWGANLIKGMGMVLMSASIVLIAYYVPGFDNVMGLLGACFAFMISAIFPLVCHYRLYRDTLSVRRKLFNGTLLLLSVVMAITGTYKSFTK